MEIPWWITQVLIAYRHVQGIHESAAFDKDKMELPRDLWFDADGSKAWYESRNPKPEPAVNPDVGS